MGIKITSVNLSGISDMTAAARTFNAAVDAAAQRGLLESIPYNLGTSLTGTVTLDRANGNSQRGTTSGNATLAVPINGTDGQTIRLRLIAGGAHTLAKDAAIGLPSDSALTLPKTLTSGLGYTVLLSRGATSWRLDSLVGGTTD